ncbi:hypothetical protein EII12_10215 [Buchananella hordeovulneris]|nr:hypothetical protein EII12_10215 [Buchananella hordeovulneris]
MAPGGGAGGGHPACLRPARCRGGAVGHCRGGAGGVWAGTDPRVDRGVFDDRPHRRRRSRPGASAARDGGGTGGAAGDGAQYPGSGGTKGDVDHRPDGPTVSARVLLAVQGPGEAALVRAIEESPQLVVARRCADLPELLAAAAAGHGDIALLDLEQEGVDAATLADLKKHQVRVVLNAPPGQTGRAHALGVAVTTTDAPPSSVVAVLERESGGRPTVPVELVAQIEQASAPAVGAGLTIAFWSGAGAPGRTVLAIETAAAVAARGHRTLLVDADTFGPCLAQSLGLLEETSAVAVACRYAAHGRLTAQNLPEMAVRLAENWELLPGLTRADRWREAPGAALASVLEIAAQIYDVVVLDLPGGLAEPGSDGFGSTRDDATLAALQAADVVVLVGAGDPVGLRRLVHATKDLEDYQLLAAPVRLVGAINRVRPTLAGRHPHAEVEAIARRYTALPEIVTICEDREGCDAALMRGQPVRSSNSHGMVANVEALVDVCLAHSPLAAVPLAPRGRRVRRHQRRR